MLRHLKTRSIMQIFMCCNQNTEYRVKKKERGGGQASQEKQYRIMNQGAKDPTRS